MFLRREELDRHLEGLYFEIARIPELFPQVSGTKLHYGRVKGIIHVIVWFTFNDTQAILLGIEPDL